ncbi:MAG: hypothetical protein IB616_01135 [Methanosarcinales archaeon]|nr:MAG: hypothetical protein IB616_01135 [Methanosarcinales archaeon]
MKPMPMHIVSTILFGQGMLGGNDGKILCTTSLVDWLIAITAPNTRRSFCGYVPARPFKKVLACNKPGGERFIIRNISIIKYNVAIPKKKHIKSKVNPRLTMLFGFI